MVGVGEDVYVVVLDVGEVEFVKELEGVLEVAGKKLAHI